MTVDSNGMATGSLGITGKKKIILLFFAMVTLSMNQKLHDQLTLEG